MLRLHRSQIMARSRGIDTSLCQERNRNPQINYPFFLILNLVVASSPKPIELIPLCARTSYIQFCMVRKGAQPGYASAPGAENDLVFLVVHGWGIALGSAFRSIFKNASTKTRQNQGCHQEEKQAGRSPPRRWASPDTTGPVCSQNLFR